MQRVRWSAPIESWKISSDVMQQISSTVGCLEPETGGMLGGNREQRLVTDFYFDGTARRTHGTYSPDVEACNRVLSERWNPRGIEMVGFVHSHPVRFATPSTGDLVYAASILRNNPGLRSMILPIVQSRSEAGAFDCRAYVAELGGNEVNVTVARLDETPIRTLPMTDPPPMFERVRESYDLNRIDRSRVIGVGCGGAASFIEDLARAGVSEFLLIDPDVYSEANIATQQAYRSDIGQAKVMALAERLRNINPGVAVVAFPRPLDALDDVAFCHLVWQPLRETPPDTVLLCGMTDSFAAQARVNRLALNFGLPSLCAQVYAEGRGAEVTFTHPDVTVACHRCLLSSRYLAYEAGFQNGVGSAGTPLSSTARLNALKQFVAMALLHHGTGHQRWGRVLTRLAKCNLAQIRLTPDLQLPAFQKAFKRASTSMVVCDETIWVPYKLARGKSGCPDCGATGNLRRVMGRFSDTRDAV